ncbi:MFS-type transporter-like protein [Dinothrombium tinctorium]|uniref:MFS-type transporter-like protein n=1 Tax=Dinothrombium tinctorium TaxID=1965070 RepID=A0A3S3PLG4_9ACAR|nr:MFS-type transporter-like protein [Dinothrombium tinctorium]
MWTGVYFNYVCYSVIAPFYPQLLNVVGPKFVIVSGLFLTGGSTFVFGFLEKCSEKYFLPLSVAIRALEGAGFSAYFTAVLTVIVKIFPANAGYYVGLTETVVTIGMITGPPFGSFLYAAGGFRLPLVTFGAIILLVSGIAMVTFQIEEIDSETCFTSITTKEYKTLLKLNSTLLAMVCVTLNVVTDNFLLITLNNHIKSYNLQPVTIGFIYMCLFLSYGLSSPLSGRIADITNLEYILQASGAFILVISFLLIGDLFVRSNENQLFAVVVGLLLKGLGAGPLICCSYTACLKAITFRRLASQDFRTFTMVSTVISFSIPLGNLIGGSTSGIMYEHFGMRLCAIIYAAIFLLLTVVCIIQSYVERTFFRVVSLLENNTLHETEIMPICWQQTIYTTNENMQSFNNKISL